MPIADKYWSGASNGNGDGKIGVLPLDPAEGHAAWDHLKRAKMVDEKDTVSVSGGSLFKGAVKNSGYQILYIKMFNRVGNALVFGASNAGNHLFFGVLSPSEARMIDKKVDNGVGNTGKLVGLTAQGKTSTLCTSVWNSFSTAGADYNLATTDSDACFLVYFVD